MKCKRLIISKVYQNFGKLAGVVIPLRSIEDALTRRPSLYLELVFKAAADRMDVGFVGFLAVSGAFYVPVAPLLLSMCVRMSFVYLSRLVIS